jgi:hypothetical protein
MRNAYAAPPRHTTPSVFVFALSEGEKHMGTVKNISGEDYDEVSLIGVGVKSGEEVEVDDALLDPTKNLWPAANWLVNGGSHEEQLAALLAAEAPAQPAPDPTPEPDPIPAEPAPTQE